MKIALVTGCSGLIGSQSVEFLIKKGFFVIGVDNHMRGYFFGEESSTKNTTKILIESYKQEFKFFNIDIRNYDELENLFKNYNESIHIVVHTAAQPSHDWAAKEPITDFTVNALGTLNLLELTRIYSNSASFIFTSTNKVYGDNPNKLNIIEGEKRFFIPYPEKQSIDETMSIDNTLHSIFGSSKVSADILVQEYGKYFKMNTVSFRGGCLTGPQHSGAELHGFLSYLVKCVVNKKHYKIFGYKGKQVRDNIHSSDLVEMFWSYYQKPKNGVVYNAGGGLDNSISIIEAIDLINKICSEHIPSWETWSDYEFLEINRTGDHIYYVTDYDKFKKDYPDWKGITKNVNEIIEEMVIYEINKKKHGENTH
jgi:CDP-paratose 2-epimerase